MQVQRVQRRSRGINLAGCLIALSACALLTATAVCVGTVVFRDSFVGIGLEVAGFDSQGRTDDIFQQTIATTPLPQIVQPSAPEQFIVSAGGYGQETVPNNNTAQLQVGQDASGQSLATVNASESDIMALCREWSPACTAQGVTESGYGIRNASVDLKNGGAVVYAEVMPSGVNFWQRVGVVMQVNGTRLTVRGVDINGILYSNPPGELASLVTEAERVANDAVRQLAVSAQGEQFTLEGIAIDENTLTVVLR